MSKIEKGSDWRIWDLHFHTPSSYDYENKSVTNEEIISILEQNNISVVAITDHHVIDIERIKELQKLGKEKNITVLPGIEFLSDARGKVPIHFIGIFPENCNLEYIWGQIENTTNIKKIKGEGKKANQVYCDLEETIKLVKELDGVTTIHAGEKSNTIENITHSLPHGEAQKTEIANQIDFYELGKIDDKEGYLKIVFPTIGKHLPMIICSDNHNINNYKLKENCWIKADCTFEGLKQVIYEPKQRVRIQSLKPHEKAEYQVIDSVQITHSDFYSQKIFLNQNLNSIIGGRSTGKSVLLGSIAKKLNCEKEVKFENEEYTKFVNEVVGSLTVTWKDGIVNNNRNIEYFPQSYMYRLAKNKNKELDKLIEDIVRQDFEKDNLISDYEGFTSENNTELTNKLNKLFQLKDDLTKKRSLLKEKGDEKGIRAEISKLERESKEIKQKINITEEKLDSYKKLKAEFDNLIKENENLAGQISKLQSLKSKFLVNKDLEFDIVALNDKNKEQVRKVYDELKVNFEKEWRNSLEKISGINLKTIEDNQRRIKFIQENQDYKDGIETFKNNKQYQELEERLKIQKNKLSDILLINKEIEELKLQVTNFKSSIKDAHRDYHKKIEDMKDALHIAKEKLEIKAEPYLNINGYKDLLNSGINQQGQQGQSIVNDPINSFEEYFTSVHDLFEKLLQDKITLKRNYSPISFAQEVLSTNFFEITYNIIYEDTFQKMSEGKKAFVVLMLLLDFSNKDCPILIDQPEDDLDNRAIFKDLVAYLKNKKKERQIILVTHNPNIVVGADSELVIVANQNGIDTPNIKGSKFQYTSGSLENTKEFNKNIEVTLESQGIKEHVCEILEGGDEAFKKRELKYALK